MSTPTLNVARYTALFSGVVYGWYHRRTLQAVSDANKLDHIAHHRKELISEAKLAWRRQQEGNKDNVISDPDDPRFDLEKLLAKWEKP